MQDRNPRLPRARFEALVERHHAAVYRSALRIVRDPASAQDVTQQVYLALLEGRITLSGDSDERVLRWFALRTALAEMRGAAHRRDREDRFAMERDTSPETDPAEARDESSMLARFVVALPVELQQALRLRFEEDMTFASIGQILAISEAGAHQRVKRALDALREKLSRAGLSALAFDVETRLGAGEQATSAPVPAGLARELAGLHGTVSGVTLSALLKLALPGAALAIVATVWLATSGSFEARQREEPAARATLANTTPAAGVAPSDPGLHARGSESPRVPATLAAAPELRGENSSESAQRSASIRGVLIDEEGRAIEGSIVVAESLEREGKLALHYGLAKSGRDGSFAISVPVDHEDGQNYRLSLQNREPFVAGPPATVRVAPGGTSAVGTLVVRHGAQDAAGDFTLVVTILDPDGAPVSGVPVRLSRRVRSADGLDPVSFEAGGASDDSGRVRLSGARVGAKQICADGRSLGFRRAWRDLALVAGAQAETIVLQKGFSISGSLRDVDGRVVAPTRVVQGFGPDIQLYASSAAEPNEWFSAQIDDNGAFEIRGLDDTDYALKLMSGPWSPICMEGVRAGTSNLAITIKRAVDPRDMGDHCAEVHARVFDAETKQPVKLVDLFALETLALPPGLTQPEFEADWIPNELWGRPYQVAWDDQELPPPSDRVRATGLSGGTWAVIARDSVHAPGFAGPFDLLPRAIVSDATIALHPAHQVRGRVLDANGSAVAGAFVLFAGNGPHSDEVVKGVDREVVETDGKPATWNGALAQADAQGAFVIGGLPPDLVFRLVALHPRREPLSSGRLRVRDAGHIELKLGARR